MPKPVALNQQRKLVFLKQLKIPRNPMKMIHTLGWMRMIQEEI